MGDPDMRVMQVCVLGFFAASAMYGQRGGARGGGGHSGSSRGASSGSHFTGSGRIGGGSFGHSSIRSFRGYSYRGGYRSYYPYPTVGFGYGYAGFPYVYDSYDSYAYAYAPAAPPVVVEQSFHSTPQSRTEYVYDPYQAPVDKETIYLIAYTDHVIRAAVAYWVEGETLHYVDREHEQHDTPLSTIDRTFSEQLNRDRRVEFRLPR